VLMGAIQVSGGWGRAEALQNLPVTDISAHPHPA
jgi:hypothetical protein